MLGRFRMYKRQVILGVTRALIELHVLVKAERDILDSAASREPLQNDFDSIQFRLSRIFARSHVIRV